MSGQLYTVDKCEIYDVYYYVFCSVNDKKFLGHIRACLYTNTWHCDENYTHKINMEVLNCNAHQKTVR